MLSATELKFSVRGKGSLPAWISGASSKRLRIWPLADAKTVTLRWNGTNVLVKVREQSSLFVGEICGYEPNGRTELQGTRVGDLIVFNQSHIFHAET